MRVICSATFDFGGGIQGYAGKALRQSATEALQADEKALKKLLALGYIEIEEDGEPDPDPFNGEVVSSSGEISGSDEEDSDETDGEEPPPEEKPKKKPAKKKKAK